MEIQETGKTAVMIGAGNIGRGFIGAAFAASGYETVFIDVDEKLVEEINTRKQYSVRTLLPDGESSDTTVKGIRAVNGNDKYAPAEIANAEICATAVGVRAMPHIAPLIAMGLTARTRLNKKPLNIIVCENMIDAGEKMRKQVLDLISAGVAPAIDAISAFPEAVIGRMTPIQTPEMKAGDPLRICVEKYAFLPVDKAAFKGEAPMIEGMVLLDNFKYYVKRKLFIHNLGHAAVAYLGLLKGYKYIAEAAEDAEILYLAESAMRESAAALNNENSGDTANLNRAINSLLYRFSNRALGDTCERVAADPLRKLGTEDRLIGSLKNCEKYGLPYIYIAAVSAAAALVLEKLQESEEKLPPLAEITGLSSESEAYKTIMTLGTTCAMAASKGGAAAVTELRRTAVKMAGDITIL